MSDLTQEHFDETMRAIADTLGDHTTILNDHTARLEKIDERLAQLADVDALRETVLDLVNRIARLETLDRRAATKP